MLKNCSEKLKLLQAPKVAITIETGLLGRGKTTTPTPPLSPFRFASFSIS